MKPFSNLDAIIQDGYRFECEMPDGYGMPGVQDVSISTHQIGKLILTSGKVLAWDLLMGPDQRYSFKRSLKPGSYAVIVSVAHFHSTGESRIACATLRVSDEQVVNWELASINDPGNEPNGEIDNYGVDSGTGSFMDVDAAQAFCDMAWGQSDSDKFEEHCDRVIAELEKNSLSELGSTNWADIRLGDAPANIIVFSSGWGDGGYASFWGYDAYGKVAALATDFALFPEVGAV
jgi:hypothetical protein